MSSQWGPSGWYLIHHMMYDLKDTTNTREIEDALTLFFNNFGKLLPCGVCRANYNKKLNEDPFTPHLKNLNDMEQWVYRFHNKVNASLNKPQFTLEQYNKTYNKNKPSDHKKTMTQFFETIGNNNIKPNMALVQIQNMKTILRSLNILHPFSNKSIKDIDKINNYESLKKTWNEFLTIISN